MRNFHVTLEAPSGATQVIQVTAMDIEDALSELKRRLNSNGQNKLSLYRITIMELSNGIGSTDQQRSAQSGQPMGETPVEDGAEEARRKLLTSYAWVAPRRIISPGGSSR